MIIAKVVGTAVSTLKDTRLEGTKLMVVCQADATGKPSGIPFLAVDLIGAGEGEVVFVAQGTTARVASGTNNAPIDAAIVGILNSMSSEGNKSYSKS